MQNVIVLKKFIFEYSCCPIIIVSLFFYRGGRSSVRINSQVHHNDLSNWKIQHISLVYLDLPHECHMSATCCHLLPLVDTCKKLKMASLKLPTDRSPRWLVKGTMSTNDAIWQVVGIRRTRAAACSSRTLRRINNIMCDSCYDALEYSSASDVIIW
jgi:hypothetical protein